MPPPRPGHSPGGTFLSGHSSRNEAGALRLCTRRTDLYLEEIDGKEGSGNGEGLLWHARSRRHGHRFLWFLLHLKGPIVVLRAEPIT